MKQKKKKGQKMENNKIVYVGAIDEKEKEHIKNNNAELKKTLESSSVDDIINPEIWKHLSEKHARQLRRWVNQFMKANIDKPEDMEDAVAYPYMNKSLRHALDTATLRIRAELTAKALKEIQTKGGQNAVQ